MNWGKFLSYEYIVTVLSNKKLFKLATYLAVLPSTIILLSFLYFYYLPFGFYKERVFTDKELINSKGEFFLYNKNYFKEIEGEIILEGAGVLKYKPRIPKVGTCAHIKLDGKDIYVVPNDLNNSGQDFNWDYSKQFTMEERNLEYMELKDYLLKKSPIYSIGMTLSLDQKLINDYNGKNSQLILKFYDLKIIQNGNQLSLRVDQYFEDTLSSYGISHTIPTESFTEEAKPYELFATYKKPTEKENGYIKMYVNNKLSGFETVPSVQKFLVAQEYEYPWYEVIYDEEMIKDFSQEIITLGQEQYTKEFLSHLISNGRPVTNLYTSYASLFEPNRKSYKSDIDNTSFFTDLYTKYFRYQEKTLLQEFYPKQFYDNFKGQVYNLHLGYTDPIPFLKESTLCFEQTPADIYLWGENGEINGLTLEFSKDNILKYTRGK